MAEGHDGSRLRLLLGLLGLLLLAVPGFAVGLLAGVVWREPGLVATHLFGGTREVAWGTPAEAGASGAPAPQTPGDVATAPAKTGDVAAAPPPARPAAAEREPAPIAAIESGPSPRLAVQVGAFGDAASAEKLAGTLRRKGFPAFVSPSTGDAGARWRVRVGPMAVRWVVTGCRGQLGRALCDQLASDPRAELIAAVDLPEVDVSDADAVLGLLSSLGSAPDALANAAAMTHVDRCEREPEAAWRANALAPGLLADACARRGCRLVHVSTDYVFSGDADRPYREEDPPAPRSQYGRSKLEGERRVLAASPSNLVVRTSWVFGRGRNFLAAILAQARERREGRASGPLRVVDDQRGRPTWSVDLAAGIRRLVDRSASGLYHLAGGGVATWWELARLCLDEAGFPDLEVERIRTAELDLPAPRPAWSVLDCSKALALGVRMRDWREAVRVYLRSEDSPLHAETNAR